MPTIRPISDLQDTNKISELCHAQQEPVFITKNGYSDLVIMSAKTYERQLAQKIYRDYRKNTDSTTAGGKIYIWGVLCE